MRKNILQAAILSINDGILSNFSLIMGLVGTGMDNRLIILAGISAMFAGALSMGIGEWLATDVAHQYSPITTALTSFSMFALGAFIPIIPFFFVANNIVIISALLCANVLFNVGVLDAKQNRIWSGLKHVVLGLFSAVITYAIGSIL